MAFDRQNVKWLMGKNGLPEAYYKIKVPSVTGILSLVPDPEYDAWVASMGKEKVEEIMKNAGYRGTSMHAYIEEFMNTLHKTKDVSAALLETQKVTPPKLRDELPEKKILEGLELFYKFYYSDFPSECSDLVGTEIGLYSDSLFFRGKADIVYKDRIHGLKLTDFKTSSGFIKKDSVKEYKYKCQLGAYSLAFNEMYKEKNIEIKSASILCINTQSEKVQEIECSGAELEHYKENFKNLAIEWHKINGSSSLLL